MRQAEDADWICMKYVEGNDMRDMTDETTEKAAETLSKIQSYFWTPSMDKAPENEVEQRFVEYWKRVLRRASSVSNSAESVSDVPGPPADLSMYDVKR